MRVLVTGGSGLVGSAIKEIKPSWTFINSKDCDLLDANAFKHYLSNNEPFDFVIHLAANVGGLFKNISQKVKMYQDNLRMNTNVIECCYNAKIPRMICCLSTCVFPDGLNNMNEDDLHLGEPHNSNFGYAYAKRMIDVHCRLINEDPNFFYQCIIPCNIYGPNDQFNDPATAHVVPALICKAAALNSIDEDTMFIMGTGTPVRQFIYSRDLAKIIKSIVLDDLRVQNLICAPNEGDECTILDVAKYIANNFKIKNVVPQETISTSTTDGQKSKNCCNNLLKSFIKDISFTPLHEGIRQTCLWYKEHKTPITPRIIYSLNEINDSDSSDNM